MILPLSVGLFACEEEKKSSDTVSTETLAAECVKEVLADSEEKDAVAESLLALLKDAGLTEAEIRASLLSLKDAGASLAPTFLSLHEKEYSASNILNYCEALQAVATAVSPEVAGAVYFSAAKSLDPAPTYTLDDCRKLAGILFGQEGAFSLDLSGSFLSGEISATTEKQLNTAILSIASGLRAAVGISDAAKNTLRTILDKALNNFFSDSALTEDSQISEQFAQSRKEIEKIFSTFLTHFDTIVGFAADYLSLGGSRLFLGLSYEKRETVLYYGYRDEDWSTTLLTEEEFNAQEGSYDRYLSLRATVKGFTVDGTFRMITEEDADLADLVYQLHTIYRAYAKQSSFEQINVRQTAEDFLTILSADAAQKVLSYLLERPEPEEKEYPEVSFDEMVTALSSLSTFDATDGVEKEEREAAGGR